MEEQTYATLLSQYEKARTDEAMRANSISVAEPAVVPVAPSKPNRKLNLVLGALVGLLGGLGLALLFENLDPSTHSAADLATAGTLPLLGQIPDVWPGQRRPPADRHLNRRRRAGRGERSVQGPRREHAGRHGRPAAENADAFERRARRRQVVAGCQPGGSPRGRPGSG